MALCCFCLSLFFFFLTISMGSFLPPDLLFSRSFEQKAWVEMLLCYGYTQWGLPSVGASLCMYLYYFSFIFLSPWHFKSAIKRYCQANLTATYFQNRSSHSSFPLHFSPHCPWMHSSLPTLFKILSPMWHVSKPIQLTKPAEKSSFF